MNSILQFIGFLFAATFVATVLLFLILFIVSIFQEPPK